MDKHVSKSNIALYGSAHGYYIKRFNCDKLYVMIDIDKS